MTSPEPSRNTGKANLAKARFFLDKAAVSERDDTFDPVTFEAYVSAVIVFGKATRDSMARQYGGQSPAESTAWVRGTTLWDDPVCKAFVDMRDLIAHEDQSVDLHVSTSVTVHVPTAMAVASGLAAIIQAIPQDPTSEELEHLRQERERDLAEAARLNRMQQERVDQLLAEHRARTEAFARTHPIERTTRARFKSDVQAIDSQPVIQLVHSYLDHLEKVLLEQQ